MLDPQTPLDEVRSIFANDRFATASCGCEVIEASPGHAVCAFEIAPNHLNAQGNVMGGAIFTLADFALAICCNLGEEPTVAVSNTIEFMSTAKGSRLIATASRVRSGRSLGFYHVLVEDDLKNQVALMSATCFRRAS